MIINDHALHDALLDQKSCRQGLANFENVATATVHVILYCCWYHVIDLRLIMYMYNLDLD